MLMAWADITPPGRSLCHAGGNKSPARLWRELVLCMPVSRAGGFAAKRSVTTAFPLLSNGCCGSDVINALKYIVTA